MRPTAPTAVREAFASASEIVLIAIDPKQTFDRDGKAIKPPPEKNVSERTVTGEATAKDRTEIRAIGDSLAEGIETTDGRFGMCFEPRHAIRIRQSPGDVMIVVCFQCLQGYVTGLPDVGKFLITRMPEKSWDVIFARHGLKKAE